MMKVGVCGFPRSHSVIFANFKLVEVQATFYKPVLKSTAERWRRAAPEDFEFTLKAWQLITHEPRSPTYRKAKLKIDASKVSRYGLFRPTKEVFEAWSATEEIRRALDSRIVVFQSPASFVESPEHIKNMHDFFHSIEIDRGDTIMVWEPRGEWKRSTISTICEELNLVHCVDPFADQPVSGTDFGYLRLHGSPPGRRMYHYSYTEADLQFLHERCRYFSQVYVLFNNYTMFDDALKFKALLKQAGNR